MEEPKRDDAAEHEARNEENKQEAKQLLKLHLLDLQRPELLSPDRALGIFNAHVLLVGVVIAFGVLAFSTGHIITGEIVFVICILLLVIVPIGVIWYLRTMLSTRTTETLAPGKQSLPRRIAKSFRSLLHLVDNRIVRLIIIPLSFASSVSMIAYAIIRFPLHSRLSLAIIVGYMTSIIISLTLLIVNSLESRLRMRINNIWEVEDKMLEIIKLVDTTATDAVRIAESSRKFIIDTETGHMEMHKSASTAISAIAHALEGTTVNTRVIKPDHVSTPPGEEEGPNGD